MFFILEQTVERQSAAENWIENFDVCVFVFKIMHWYAIQLNTCLVQACALSVYIDIIYLFIRSKYRNKRAIEPIPEEEGATVTAQKTVGV